MIDEYIVPECWQVLCQTDTYHTISNKRLRQIADRMCRSWGRRL